MSTTILIENVKKCKIQFPTNVKHFQCCPLCTLIKMKQNENPLCTHIFITTSHFSQTFHHTVSPNNAGFDKRKTPSKGRTSFDWNDLFIA